MVKQILNNIKSIIKNNHFTNIQLDLLQSLNQDQLFDIVNYVISLKKEYIFYSKDYFDFFKPYLSQNENIPNYRQIYDELFIIKNIFKKYKIKEAYLHGSIIHGYFCRGSDIDIAVKGINDFFTMNEIKEKLDNLPIKFNMSR